MAARTVWGVVALFAVGCFLYSLRAGYVRLLSVCLESECASDQLTPTGVDALESMGLSIGAYATYHMLLVIVFAVVNCAIAAIIAWRKSDQPIALFVSLTLIIFGVFVTEYIEVLRGLHPIMGLLLDVMSSLGWILFPVLFYVFPDGRFVPAWTRYVIPFWVATQLPYLIFLSRPSSPWIPYFVVGEWPALLALLLFFSLFCTCIFAQVYRYRSVSDPIQRQQTKWVVFGMITTVVVIVGSLVIDSTYPSLMTAGTPYDLVENLVQLFSFLLIPLTIGIAIMRYRLWDIDLIINQTLVYGSLTVLLTLTYFIGVVSLQTALRTLTTHQSELSVIGTTLAVSMLFNPLRRQIQLFIDRQFYRQKYDAAQTFAAFVKSIRDEVDLAMLIRRLESTIQETMQPVCVLTWLRQQSDSRLFQCVTEQRVVKPVTVPYTENEVGMDDPLVQYIDKTSDAIEVERLDLDSALLKGFKAHSIKLIVPLICQGELIGWIALGVRLGGQGYASDDQSLLVNLANQTASSIQTAQLIMQHETLALERERYSHELRVARHVQQTLLPAELPTLLGWKVGVYWQPARAVGGDFYDFLPLSDGRMVLIVGDVADKGVPAALIMAMTRTILRSVAQQASSPGAALARVNELLYPETPPQMFVTCLYGILEPTRGRLRFANAGHNCPYRYGNGKAVELRATGMPLGLLPSMSYEEYEATIEPGESLLLYSDGLVEAHNLQNEMFGFPRLEAWLQSEVNTDGTLIEGLVSELARFVGEAGEQEDDVTLVNIERIPDSRCSNALFNANQTPETLSCF